MEGWKWEEKSKLDILIFIFLFPFIVVGTASLRKVKLSSLKLPTTIRTQSHPNFIGVVANEKFPRIKKSREEMYLRLYSRECRGARILNVFEEILVIQ